jgi:hypothetical protein
MNAFKRSPEIPESLFEGSDEQDAEIAAKMLETFCGSPKPPKKTRTISDSVFAKVRRDVEAMIVSGDWSEATPRDFVALYAMLHNRVYGVEPEDLTSTTRLHAAAAARRLLDRSFGGDPGEFASFIRWVWIREESREKWRVQNNISGGRVSWYKQFNGALVTDWRVERRAPGSQTRIKS